ncbi:hypothetical protein A2U01_0018054, partial [Trifolium medium]|nr:hypothetical protein [Trifolium medium]
MLFDRIPKLKPKDSDKYVSTMPHVFKYKTLRGSSADWCSKLESLSQSDCPHCVRDEETEFIENTVGEAGREGGNHDTSDVEALENTDVEASNVDPTFNVEASKNIGAKVVDQEVVAAAEQVDVVDEEAVAVVAPSSSHPKHNTLTPLISVVEDCNHVLEDV